MTAITRRDIGRLFLRGVIILGAWTLAGLYFAAQHHIHAIAQGDRGDFVERYTEMFIAMSVWALMTPFVIVLTERFPIRRPHPVRNTAIAIGIAVGTAIVRAPLDIFIVAIMAGVPIVFDKGFVADWITASHIHLILASVLVCIVTFTRMQRETVERRRAAAQSQTALAQVKLRRLQSDLKPHFLFNALNAVAALVHSDPPAAMRMLDTLSDLLRRSIESEHALEVTLAEELQFVERYLDIQKTRFGNRLSASVHVDSVELLRCAIPPFLIQPLVENAVVHGVSARRESGTVEVRVRGDARWLDVEVRDDGPGCDATAAAVKESVGVPHAIARLRYLYGTEQELSFRREEGAFIVAVRLPMHPIEHAANR